MIHTVCDLLHMSTCSAAKLQHAGVQAVENVKDKIKSALPTSNVFDPASLQVLLL